MPLLTGNARFNGSLGEYSVLLDGDRFEREIRIGSLSIWEALDNDVYWQSNFGSPVYRRPGPFSTHEAKQWLAIWRRVIETAEQVDELRESWEITSSLGNTNVQLSNRSLISTTDVGNITEFEILFPQSSEPKTLMPVPPSRIDFSLPFDLSIGIPRAKLFVGDKQIQVMIDTGADHSIFASNLTHEEHGLKVKVNAGGGVVDFTLGALQDVRFGDVLLPELHPFFTSFDTMPGPLRFLRGIIGQDILGRSAVTFDQKRGLLIGKSEWEDAPDWPLDGSYTQAIVDGIDGWYRIDTGSSFTLHKYSGEVFDGNRPGTVHRGLGGRMQVKPLTVKTIQLDDAHFSNIQAFQEYTADDPIIIAGNIGNQLLKDLDITMDFSKGLAKFTPHN
jgi:hypothetical protein